MAEIVGTYYLNDENPDYHVLEVYNNGAVLIKNVLGVIKTRHNPTLEYKVGLGKNPRRITDEVGKIMEQLDCEDAVSRRLATAWVSGKAQSLSSGLELLRRNSASDQESVTVEKLGDCSIRVTGGELAGDYGQRVDLEDEQSQKIIEKILSL